MKNSIRIFALLLAMCLALPVLANADSDAENARRLEAAAAPFQKEIAALYKELKTINKESVFHQLGFAQGSPAREWKARADALGDRAQAAPDVPLQVKAAPAQLVQLAQEWVKRPHGSDFSRWVEKEIQAAIAWKYDAE